MEHELHPILEQMSPSPDQKDPILARGKDIVVTAGAGTGKTRTLVARYLSLLAEGLPLRGILAITFTKKAAREMRNRVRKEIRQYILAGSQDGVDHHRWREIYDKLDAARISTIHTLCAEILRHHPAESGVDPAFDMIDEGEMALFRAQAVDQAMGWAVDVPQTAKLFSAFGSRELRKILNRMVEKRLDVDQALDRNVQPIWPRWKEHLLTPILEFLDHPVVREHFQTLQQLREDGTLQEAESAGDRLAPDLRRLLACWDRIEMARSKEDWVQLSRNLAPLRDFLKQKGRKENWAPVEPKSIIAEIQEIYDDLLAPIVKDGLDLALDEVMAEEILPALVRLYEKAVRVYSESKRKEQSLDFDDLEWNAVRLLKEDLGVRRYWQRQIQALLVDEFQDTNDRQRDLLDFINGSNGNLFIVGDAKQSIYRFRGADVAVFREEEDEIRNMGEGYHLATSYRGHEALVTLLNKLLSPVLGDEPPAKPFVAPFQPLTPHRKEPKPGIQPPFVEFHLSVGSKSEGALDQAAEAVVARLAGMIDDQGSRDIENGAESFRNLDYGDVAILCRASSSFPAYERALEKAGIPFLTIAGRGFYDRPEVRDVLNALQALADPFDDHAVAGLLRSPAGGLSDLALHKLREAQEQREISSLFNVLFEENLSFLGQEEAQAIRIRTWMESMGKRVGRVPVSQLLKEFLDHTHYLSALQWAGLTRGKNNLRKLLGDAHRSGMVSVGRFLNYIHELRDVSVREGEAQSISSGAVQIMTVHQAKGMEFPIVVIGDLSRGSPRMRDVITDDLFGVVPPMTADQLQDREAESVEVNKVGSAVYRLAREREKEEQEAESDRLLYVAATRAEDKLLLSGVLRGIRKNGTPYSLRGWLDKLGGPLGIDDITMDYHESGSQIHENNIGDSNHPIACFIYEPEVEMELHAEKEDLHSIQSLPENFSHLAPVHQEGRVQPTEEEMERQVWQVVPDQMAAKAPAWLVGKVVHKALAQWLFPDHPDRDFEIWATREAESSGLTGSQVIEDAVERSSRLLNTFQDSSLFQEMDTAEHRYHELPYSVQKEGIDPGQGLIDAVYKNRDGWVLVEFKTDRVQGAQALDDLLDEKDYVDQVESYLTAVETILGRRPHPVLCFLNCDQGVKLITDAWGLEGVGPNP